jgi:hypothetical protein
MSDDYNPRKASVGMIFSSVFGLLGRQWLTVVGAGIALGGAQLLAQSIIATRLSVAPSMTAGAIALVALPVTIIVHYAATRRMMGAEGLADRKHLRLRPLSFLGVILLVGLVAMLGVILLVLPGLYLAGGLYLATVFAIGRDMAPVAAMKASWQATKGSRWSILGGHMAIVIVWFLALMIVGFVAGIVMGATHTQGILPYFSQALGGFAAAVLICPPVAVFGLLVGDSSAKLEEVFA